jgi:hypothetical protein
MEKMLHRIVCTVLFVSSFSFSQKTADFLILDQPKKYTILNQYQTPLSEPERNGFVPFTPLQIINRDETLGDQITRALTGMFEGKIWYLQKDDAGDFLGSGAKDGRQEYKNCGIGGDTVEIVKEKTVPFSPTITPVAGPGFLDKGETVVRVFQYRDKWYVKRPGRPARFCWCTFSARSVQSGWRKIVTAAVVDTGISNYLQDRIIERFRNANDTYRKYFSHFNTVTVQEKTIPVWHWDLQPQDRTVHCFLNAPYRTGAQLDESTRYLVRDLENMLIGKQYDVVCEKGDITIKPRDRDMSEP